MRHRLEFAVNPEAERPYLDSLEKLGRISRPGARENAAQPSA